MTTAVPGRGYGVEVVPFRAGDGFECNLHHLVGDRPPTRGPVLFVHGAGVRANLFRPPLARTVADGLLEAGYDVWLENWRGSIDLRANDWDLDQAALHDHPAAVREVVARTGWGEVKAVIHCQGSTGFALSAAAGLLPQVRTIVANGVTFHPVVPRWSRFKLRFLVPAVGLMTDHLDPSWGTRAPTLAAKLIDRTVRLFHHECGNAVCKHVSFTYGAGRPALWRHENLDAATHDWLRGEFARVPMTFFRQMARCVRAGQLVSNGTPGLPARVADAAPKTDARFVLLTGTWNRCFLPESQRRSFAYLDGHRPGFHALHEFPTYSHLDIFLGERAATDVLPVILRELG